MWSVVCTTVVDLIVDAVYCLDVDPEEVGIVEDIYSQEFNSCQSRQGVSFIGPTIS
jgi:hypothetical protein